MTVQSSESRARSAFAIVGMSGRFPGAQTLDEFWLNLRDGVESRTEFSDEDLAAEGVSLKLKHPNHVRSGFALKDIDMFDSAFFGINPKEADTLDPQHRMFLECAWSALEDAGYDSERYAGTIGLFAGSTWCNYLIVNLFRSAKLTKTVGHRQLIFGSVPDYMVTRAAYRLNLKGPAYFVQSACSTSLSAVHLACQSLEARECDIVLAGGVSVKVPHRVGYVYEEGGMESPDGRVRTFDANARGTVFSSGVGVVVLKRLEDALRDHDHIHAVVKGTATNNDGSVKIGFTAPSVAGQADVVRQAFENAGVSPDDIDYVETHGTGTELGDPIELAALARAFAGKTSPGRTCGVGSVKPNIGHLDAAAGVSSLIKTVLAMQHKQLPPSINFETLNPKIELEGTPFYINTTLRDWNPREGKPRRAGVSSFGFGGTNAHVVLEEAPAPEIDGRSRSHQLLIVSARTRTALEAASLQLANHLSRDARAPLPDIAYTLQVGRKQFAARKAIVCHGREDAIEALQGDSGRWVSTGQADSAVRRVVFLFPGQGSQYVGMGRGLYDGEPVFRKAVDECAEILRVPLGMDLRSALYPEVNDEEASRRLKRTAVTQAAVFTIEFALARLWMHWGLVPSAMAGHSIGEFVAACISGVLTLEDALRLVALRGQLMEQMPEGAMLAIPLPEDRVRKLLGEGLWLAAVNGPAFTVVSGRHEAIERLILRLAEQGVEGKRLHTSHAFHSGMMDDAVGTFVEAVRAVPLSAPGIPYLSNVTGTWATESVVTDPSYWGRHIRETVRFSDNVAALVKEKSILLEVGPGNALSTFVRQQIAPQDGHTVVSSLRHPQDDSADTPFLLNALGKIWTAGAVVDWDAFYEEEHRRRISLPTYPFERTRHWVHPDKPNAAGLRRMQASNPDDLADWFFVPSWRRASAPMLEPKTDRGAWLIFADELGIGDAVARRLRDAGCRTWTVRAGEHFADEKTSFRIDPTSVDDYGRLIKAIHQDSGARPTGIVQLWGIDRATSGSGNQHDRGFYSLLYLAQALGNAGVTSKLALSVVTTGVQRVTGEEMLEPEKATALGPARVIPLEFPSVVSRAIDLNAAELTDSEATAESLVRELLSDSDDRTIAYRRGRRWVQTFEPTRLMAVNGNGNGLGTGHHRIREGGTYLITGGYGGIGLVLAEWLAKHYRCNLVLTGRQGLPARDTWGDHIARFGDDDRLSRRILAVQRLESAGGKVWIGEADVADLGRMRAVVAEAQAQFGRIDGVIHSAGVAGGGLIQLKTPDVAAAVLKPKVEGTQVLGEIFREQRLDFFLLCSSLTSVLGGVGQVDYCAANAYLDAFAEWYTATTGTFTTAVNWSAWQEVGMAVETAIHDSLRGAMRDQMLAVGLNNRDGSDAFARILSYASDAQVAVSPLHVQTLLDKLRENQDEDQQSSDGGARTDHAESAHARPEIGSAFVAPGSETEKRICTIWREMLGIEEVGVNDSFFDLGGHSLLAVRVMTRVNEALGTEIPVARLYEGLTVAYIARLADNGADAGKSPSASHDATERRREKVRKQKEHQQRRLAATRR